MPDWGNRVLKSVSRGLKPLVFQNLCGAEAPLLHIQTTHRAESIDGAFEEGQGTVFQGGDFLDILLALIRARCCMMGSIASPACAVKTAAMTR